MRTLIIIDVQNDFMPGGALAVNNTDKIIDNINYIQDKFTLIVATQHWHPSNHICFASNHKNVEPFTEINIDGLTQTAWPDHCVQGTIGADFHPRINTNKFSAIFRKGMNPKIDSYSAFYDNNHIETTGLASYLNAKEAKDLYFCGLCTDICVLYSTLDAVKAGFTCYLIEDAACPLVPENMPSITQQLTDIGVKIINCLDL